MGAIYPLSQDRWVFGVFASCVKANVSYWLYLVDPQCLLHRHRRPFPAVRPGEVRRTKRRFGGEARLVHCHCTWHPRRHQELHCHLHPGRQLSSSAEDWQQEKTYQSRDRGVQVDAGRASELSTGEGGQDPRAGTRTYNQQEEDPVRWAGRERGRADDRGRRPWVTGRRIVLDELGMSIFEGEFIFVFLSFQCLLFSCSISKTMSMSSSTCILPCLSIPSL